jgi:hypothetical protein
MRKRFVEDPNFGVTRVPSDKPTHALKIPDAFSAGTSVGLGMAAGLALSFGLNRLIVRWIESGTRDPILVLAASGLLILVAALACMVPARRALAVDPMVALRCE